MFGKELLIKKFPYLSFSPNIMEYFGIIGYQESFVPQILDSYRKKKNSFAPIILSSITSNTDYGIVDNNLIVSQIYPDNPIAILINKNESSQDLPPTNNAIYSFCFDSSDGKTKLFYICYAFKFYEKYKYYITKNNYEEYYIPKAFCIVSQYYYFTLFEYICRNIYNLIFKKDNILPIEITIYNIVNFIPSPINYRLNLDLFSYEIEVHDIQNVEIGQLSGYPYLDFDLSEIFNLLSLNLVLEIFILTFLEQSMIFFSSNLELLNMVMFIMYVLNYPCNDSTYFWHIVSVSKDNFVDENKFVGKLMVCLIGINATYSDDFDTSAFSRFNYIVDIDNKKVFIKKSSNFCEDEDSEEFNNCKNLQAYIQNIIKDKDKNNDSIFLKPFIERIRKALEILLSKNPDFNFSPKNKFVNFFKCSKDIIDKNKKIQEIFYDFCLNLLTIFYQDNSLSSSFDKIQRDQPKVSNQRIFKLRKLEEKTQMNANEIYFCEVLRGAIKYKIYFENFISNFETIDVFQIPLYFSEEFINIKMKDISNKLINKLSLFNIIDNLYFQNNQQIINITLNNIFSAYLEKLKKYFKHFINSQKTKNEKEHQLIKLNKNILNKYIYLLNNFYSKEELMDLFPSIRLQKGELIPKFDRRNILNILLNHLEQKNYFDYSTYLIFALVYIFAISIPLYSYKNMLIYLEQILKLLPQTKFFLRHHIYILIKSYYKYYFIHKDKQIYPELRVTCIKMYFLKIIDFLNENLLVPNEEIMAIFNPFFTKIILQERESIKVKEDNEVDNEANFKIEKDKNFLCFMKHCFTSKKTFKQATMVSAAIKEKNNCNIIIRGGVKQLQPTAEIRIQDYSYSSDFFSPKKVYKLIQLTYNDFFDNSNLDMSKLKIKNVRDVIANLILYGVELNKSHELIPIDFLIYTLYLFKNHEDNCE